MDNKALYQSVCDTANIPIHAQYWWMCATAVGKQWDVIAVRNGQGKPVAMLPVHIWQRFGVRCVVMPPHTQLTWLWKDLGVNKAEIYPRMAKEIDAYLRKHHIALFYIQGYFPEELLRALEFYRCVVKERVTYRIAPTDMEQLFHAFSTNKQRLIKKAAKNGILLSTLSVDGFYAVHSRFLAQKGKKIDYPLSMFEALASEAIRRNQGCIMAAVDSDAQVLAAVFLVWDSEVCYYLLPTYNADYANSGAMAWLTMQAIQFAFQRGLVFDFEGSMSPSIANSYAQFGSSPATYYSVEKVHPLVGTLLRLKNMLIHS